MKQVLGLADLPLNIYQGQQRGRIQLDAHDWAALTENCGIDLDKHPHTRKYGIFYPLFGLCMVTFQ